MDATPAGEGKDKERLEDAPTLATAEEEAAEEAQQAAEEEAAEAEEVAEEREPGRAPAPAPAQEAAASGETEQEETQKKEKEKEKEKKTTADRRLLIITTGSRGDVQPFLALAQELVGGARWEVAIATHGSFDRFVHDQTAGAVRFYPLEGDPAAVLHSPAFIHAAYNGSAMDMGNILLEETKKIAEPNYRLSWDAARDFRPHMILASMVAISESQAIAQKLRCPLVIASSIPLYPSREYALVTIRPKPFALGFMNRLLHWAVYKAAWSLQGAKMINKFRQELQLPTQDRFQFDCAPWLNFYSDRLAPRPKDWPEFVHNTGYWTLAPVNDNAELPEEVEQFLQSGSAPVYMGFGSMPLKDPKATAACFVEVMIQLGMRGILCVGWASREAFEEAVKGNEDVVLLVNDVPHELLLPRCSMAIHHGGAGTTAASLRAGIPTVIFPFFGDQPFWAHRLADLGVGPASVATLKDLKRETLLSQIVAASSEDVKKKAASLGEVLRSDKENGVKNAASFLNKYVDQFRIPENDGDRTKQDDLYRWIPDEESSECMECKAAFSFTRWRHHCRMCGGLFCGSCVRSRHVMNYPISEPQLVCLKCSSIRSGHV